MYWDLVVYLMRLDTMYFLTESAKIEVYLQVTSVQWVRTEAHALLHILASLGLQEIVFIITYAKKLVG